MLSRKYRALCRGCQYRCYLWGFVPHHGGTLQFINAMGLEAFITRSRELAEQYGERFQPAQIVLDMAAKGEVFSDD